MRAKFLALIKYRKLSRGFELFGHHRFSTTNNWRNKPHPYYFRATYPGGSKTVQIMRFEYWKR